MTTKEKLTEVLRSEFGILPEDELKRISSKIYIDVFKEEIEKKSERIAKLLVEKWKLQNRLAIALIIKGDVSRKLKDTFKSLLSLQQSNQIERIG